MKWTVRSRRLISSSSSKVCACLLSSLTVHRCGLQCNSSAPVGQSCLNDQVHHTAQHNTAHRAARPYASDRRAEPSVTTADNKQQRHMQRSPDTAVLLRLSSVVTAVMTTAVEQLFGFREAAADPASDQHRFTMVRIKGYAAVDWACLGAFPVPLRFPEICTPEAVRSAWHDTAWLRVRQQEDPRKCTEMWCTCQQATKSRVATALGQTVPRSGHGAQQRQDKDAHTHTHTHTHRRTDTHTYTPDRWRGNQGVRQTERQAGKHIGRQTHTHTYGLAGRKADTHTHSQEDRESVGYKASQPVTHTGRGHDLVGKRQRRHAVSKM